MDFGLATFYMDKNGVHKDMVKTSPRGSPDYALLFIMFIYFSSVIDNL